MKKAVLLVAVLTAILGWKVSASVPAATFPLRALAMQSHLPPPGEPVGVYFVDIEVQAPGKDGTHHVVGVPSTFLQEGERCAVDLGAFGGKGHLEVTPVRKANAATFLVLSYRCSDGRVETAKLPLQPGKVVRVPDLAAKDAFAAFHKTVQSVAGLKIALRARKI